MSSNANQINENKKQQEKNIHDYLIRCMGEEFCQLMQNPNITDVMLNSDGRLWVQSLSEPTRCLGDFPAQRASSIINIVASYYGRTVTEDNPVVEGKFPYDKISRFEGVIPPCVPSPIFAIRKHSSKILTFDDYLNGGVMNQSDVDIICQHIQNKSNIMVCGGTGSGKTTLLNCLIQKAVEYFPERRRIVIEDTPELKQAAPNCNMLVAQQENPHADGLAMLRACMRLNPDSIDYGEVRDKAAHTLLKAWTTGHPGGFGTVHTNPGSGGIVRIEQLLLESIAIPQPHLIAEGIQLFVQIQKTGHQRKLTNLVWLKGYKNGEYIIEELHK